MVNANTEIRSEEASLKSIQFAGQEQWRTPAALLEFPQPYRPYRCTWIFSEKQISVIEVQ